MHLTFEDIALEAMAGADLASIERGCFAIYANKAIAKLPEDTTRDSVVQTIAQAAMLGLYIDNQSAHMLTFRPRPKTGEPFVSVAYLHIDYKGLVKLALRNADVKILHADVFCREDDFEFNLGRVVRHKIDFGKDRGEVLGSYAQATFKAGHEQGCVVPLKDIQKAKARSKAPGEGPWTEWWGEMAKKVAIRRLVKLLDLSPHLDEALKDLDIEPLATERPALLEKIMGEKTPPI